MDKVLHTSWLAARYYNLWPSGGKKRWATRPYWLAALLVCTLGLCSWQPSFAQAASSRDECHATPLAGWLPYRVQRSNTLAELANRHGTTVAQIRQQNCLLTEQMSFQELLLLPATVISAVEPPTATPESLPSPTLPAPALPTTAPAQPISTQARSVSQPTPLRIATATPVQPLEKVAILVSVTPPPQPTLAAQVETSRKFTSEQLLKLSTSAFSWVRAIILVDLLILIALLIGALFFVRRQNTSLAAAGSSLLRFGYLLFLLTGFLFGLFAFPVLRPPITIDLITSVSTLGSVSLVMGLALRELLVASDQRWRLVKVALNVILVPLWFIFLLTIVNRILEVN